MKKRIQLAIKITVAVDHPENDFRSNKKKQEKRNDDNDWKRGGVT